MKYCPVMPPYAIELLDSIEHDNLGYFGYADFAYQHDWYSDYLRQKDYVVLDCPIVEHGTILEPKQLASVVKKVKPTFTIIPDKVFDFKETMSMFMRYAEVIADASMCGVLQGTTRQELERCASEMVSYGVSKLAIPRISVRNGGIARSELLPHLACLYPHISWHLLGARFPYVDEVVCKWLASSCDTAEPVNAAMNSTFMSADSVSRQKDFLSLEQKDVAWADLWLHANVATLAEHWSTRND